MACALTPNLTEQNFLQLLVEAVKKNVWDKIKGMAIRAATKLSAAGGAEFEAENTKKDDLWRGRGTNSSAGIRSAGDTSSLARNGLYDRRASVAGNTSVGCFLGILVDEEIESFLKFTRGLVMPHDFEPQDVLIGRCIFGNPASAAGIERDFGIAGVLLNPRRTNLDTFVVEMILFLYINGEHIPWNDIPHIDSKKRYTIATPTGSSTLNEANDGNNRKADRIFTAEDIENDLTFSLQAAWMMIDSTMMIYQQ
ncbi:hypothetical protein Plhal304r1_c027g0089381 [Plasmopara halstedii]